MAASGMVETDGYAKSKLLPDDVSKWRREAEEFIKDRKAGGRSTSPLDIEAKWSVTAIDDKKGSIKYSAKDLENQVKREMATTLERVMDDSGKINTKSPIYKQLEQIEAGRGPASQRIGLALKHNGGNISYSEDLTAVQERLQAAKNRGPTPSWEASRKVEQVIAKAEQAATKAMPAVVEAVEKHGGEAVKFAGKHGGKAVQAVAALAGVVGAMAAEASEIKDVPGETGLGKSSRVAKVGADYLAPGSKDLIEGRNMCKNAFGVASQVVGNGAGAAIGGVTGTAVGALAAVGTTVLASPTGPAAPFIGGGVGLAVGVKTTEATYDTVNSGIQNMGKKLSGMVCGA